MGGNVTSGDMITVAVAEDFSSAQYSVVYLNSSGQAALLTVPNSAGAPTFGVIYNDANAAGKNGLIRRLNASGKVQVLAGGSISIGNRLTVTTSGQVVAVQSHGIQWEVGMAATAAGSAGERIDMYPMSPQVNSL